MIARSNSETSEMCKPKPRVWLVRGRIPFTSTHGTGTRSPFSRHFYHFAHKNVNIPARDPWAEALANAWETELSTADVGKRT